MLRMQERASYSSAPRGRRGAAQPATLSGECSKDHTLYEQGAVALREEQGHLPQDRGCFLGGTMSRIEHGVNRAMF